MYLFSLFCFIILIGFSKAQTYSTKYDNIDVDQVLSNKRVLDNYLKCILDEEKRCSPEAREFRKHIPEAIRTNCNKCSDAQKNIVRKTARYIMNNRPADWERIRQKFDPRGEYKYSFMTFLNQY